MSEDLHVRVWGDGERAVLMHGSMSTGRTTWSPQRELADEGFRLLVPDRRGYGRSPDADGEDYEVDARDVADLVGDGAHLVGHSYGALGALLAAARRPAPIRSLVVVEPPAFAVSQDDEDVAAFVEAQRDLWSRGEDLSDRAFMERFIRLMGTDPDELPDELLQMWTRRTAPMRHGRRAWEADLPLDALADLTVPVIVVSGDHSPVFERICDDLAERIGARRESVRGAGHEVQRTGEPFNRLLLRAWRSAD